MNRQTLMLTALGAVLVLVLYWLFLLSPKRSELSETNEQIVAAQDRQVQLQGELNRLRDLRREAPAIEARLAAGEAVIPSDAAVPAMLRQLQQAADDAAVRLTSISASRPSDISIDGAPGGVGAMTLAVVVEGSYFQLVDFLRRIEDPTITPRAVLWQSISVAPAEYPTLSASMSGQMFVLDRAALAGG